MADSKANPFEPMFCGYCGAPATHFCSGCGKWICDRFLCNAKGAAVALGIRVKANA